MFYNNFYNVNLSMRLFLTNLPIYTHFGKKSCVMALWQHIPHGNVNETLLGYIYVVIDSFIITIFGTYRCFKMI